MTWNNETNMENSGKRSGILAYIGARHNDGEMLANVQLVDSVLDSWLFGPEADERWAALTKKVSPIEQGAAIVALHATMQTEPISEALGA
jgi:hypothetical protein